MLRHLDRMASETLGALNRETLDDPASVLEFFQTAAREKAVLDAGINRQNEPRTARVLSAAGSEIELIESNLGAEVGRELYFNSEIGGATFFFALSPVKTDRAGILRSPLPCAIYRAERRDASRAPIGGKATVLVSGNASPNRVEADILDRSLQGLSLRFRDADAQLLPSTFAIQEGDDCPQAFARVCHRTPLENDRGWTRVGVSISAVNAQEPIQVDRRKKIVDHSSSWQNLRTFAEFGMEKARSGLGFGSRLTREVEIVEFGNNKRQPVRGILNSWGSRSGSTAVVIPPAWGKTKETSMPLALTIVETFKRAGQPVQVLRYDGTNRRGESHVDPECRSLGSEHLHFRFSQAASEVSSAVDFLHSDPGNAPRRIVLVTFSLAAVEGRCAMVRESSRVDGWVAVVGVADLQSALRTISGGVDYGYGLLRGVRFGCHELVGVVADMDLTGLDAIEHEMGFLEDARRDMSNIESPVTWIHGRHDAWMDLDRVAEIMSCGNTSNRKLIEVPTGHRLRSSRAALSTFRLIAEEVSEMALGERLKSFAPSLQRIAETRKSELGRLPDRQADLRSFWKDYLLGRDQPLGMELLTATAAYRNFMETQLQLLRSSEPQIVFDIGAGTGDFALALASSEQISDVGVVEVDFVFGALKRAAERRTQRAEPSRVRIAQCTADLDLGRGGSIPFASETADALLASLVISYLRSPQRLLREAFRVLRPGGRIVISSMLEDADISMLLHDGLIEFATTEARKRVSSDDAEKFDVMVRSFLNDGSRLLDLEDQGQFRFWNAESLAREVANAGFARIRSVEALGKPAQAVIVSAFKP